MLSLYDCTSTAWSPENPITLTIVSGSEYASFHKIDSQTGADVKVGSVLTTTVDDNEGYSLVADGIQPDSIAEWVVIEGESGGLSNMQSVQIMPPPVVVTIVPSTLSPGDTVSIDVKQRNPDGTISDFPPDQQFEVGISSGDTCGTILSPDGDSTADYFFSIQQGFKFIAADSINGDSVTVGIRVGIPPANPIPCSMIPGGRETAAQGGPVAHGASQLGNTTTSIHARSSATKSSAKVKTPSTEKASAKKGGLKSVSDDISFSYAGYGIGWAEIKSPTLKIVDHYPWSIWPDLPPGAVPSKEANPSGYNHKRGFTISVTDGEGKPIQNALVEIKHDYQQGTGGHTHAASERFLPDQSLQGIFWRKGKGGTYLDLTTDENGIAIVDSLVASQISGMYLITAFLKSDPSVKDTVNLAVQVPGLVNFRDLIFIPNGEEPCTFLQTPPGEENHPDNDYCTTAMGSSLFLAILDFNFWSGSPIRGGVPRILSLNDMSLPWGGLFDGMYANWQPPHSYHRIGRSVDINSGGLFQYPDPNDSNVPIMTRLGTKLEYWMNHHHGYRVVESNSVHYEFYDAY